MIYKMENNLLGLHAKTSLTSSLTTSKKANEIKAQDVTKTDAASARDGAYKNIQDEANQSSAQNTKPKGSSLPNETAASGNKAVENATQSADANTSQEVKQEGEAASSSKNPQAITQNATDSEAETEHDNTEENLPVAMLINPEIQSEVIVKPVAVEDDVEETASTNSQLSASDLELIQTRVDKGLLKEAPLSIKDHIASAIVPSSDSPKSTSELPPLAIEDDVVLAKMDIGPQEELKIKDADKGLEIDESDIEAEAIHKKLAKELGSIEQTDESKIVKPAAVAIDSQIKLESTVVKEKSSATDILNSSQISDTKSISSAHHSKLTYKAEARPENPLADKIFLMINKNENSAKLMIEPAELGPMEIKISQQDGTTHILFNTQTLAAKDAIQSQINELRDIFGQQGLNLGDVGVFHQNEQSNNEQSFSSNRGFSNTSEANATESISLVRNIRGLVDLYA